MAKKKKRGKRGPRNVNPARKKGKLLQAMPGTKIKEINKGTKLSEAILEFAEPLMDKCETVVQQKRLIDLAILAWNISYLPKDQQEQEKEKIIKNLWRGDSEAQSFMKAMFDCLLERKEKYFAHEKRVIINYDVSELSDRLNLTVLGSTQKNKPIRPNI